MPVRECNVGFDCKIKIYESLVQKIPYQYLLTVRSGVRPKTLGTVTLEEEKLFQMNTNRKTSNNIRLILPISSRSWVDAKLIFNLCFSNLKTNNSTLQNVAKPFLLNYWSWIMLWILLESLKYSCYFTWALQSVGRVHRFSWWKLL